MAPTKTSKKDAEKKTPKKETAEKKGLTPSTIMAWSATDRKKVLMTVSNIFQFADKGGNIRYRLVGTPTKPTIKGTKPNLSRFVTKDDALSLSKSLSLKIGVETIKEKPPKKTSPKKTKAKKSSAKDTKKEENGTTKKKKKEEKKEEVEDTADADDEEIEDTADADDEEDVEVDAEEEEEEDKKKKKK